MVVVLLCSPTLAGAQTARVRSEENFRRVPNGQILARLQAGTPLTVVGRGDAWLEVELEGWVWTSSLQAAGREGFDLVVWQGGGENLRAAPSGEILGRLQEGMLLEELERRPAWIQVRRRGWIWEESVVVTAAPPPGRDLPPPPSWEPGGFVEVGAGGSAILSAPDGDTLALTAPRTEVEVVAREGNWARVRLEGWAWLPPTDSSAPSTEASGVTPADLARDPDGHRGRVVAWSLQFISLERAERVRTDFFEGEPFILARFGDADGPFVYVAVPPQQMSQVEGLAPLERVSVTGRVRTGASVLTGTPIIDLIALERQRDSG